MDLVVRPGIAAAYDLYEAGRLVGDIAYYHLGWHAYPCNGAPVVHAPTLRLAVAALVVEVEHGPPPPA